MANKEIIKEVIFRPERDKVVKDLAPKMSSSIKALLTGYKKRKISRNELQSGLEDILSYYLAQVVVRGYEVGCKQKKRSFETRVQAKLVDKAKRRAKKATQLIIDATNRALGIKAAKAKKKGHTSLSEKTVDSLERADNITWYEAPRMFFLGARIGFGSGKRVWITTNENSCEDCQGNEDDGPVAISEPFSSGDMEPPLHPGCGCYIGMRG